MIVIKSCLIISIVASLLSFIMAFLILNANLIGFNDSTFHLVDIIELPKTALVYSSGNRITTGTVAYNFFECIYCPTRVTSIHQFLNENSTKFVNFKIKTENETIDLCDRIFKQGNPMAVAANGVLYYSFFAQILLAILVLVLLCQKDNPHIMLPKCIFIGTLINVSIVLFAVILYILSQTDFYPKHGISNKVIKDNNLPIFYLSYTFIGGALIALFGQFILAGIFYKILRSKIPTPPISRQNSFSTSAYDNSMPSYSTYKISIEENPRAFDSSTDFESSRKIQRASSLERIPEIVEIKY